MNCFIIVDVSKCIGCCICEVVCVVFYQENQDCVLLILEIFLLCIYVIKGVNIFMVIVCCQCEDVLCVNVCLNGAISCDKGFVYVMQECCIGCKICVVVCLYGVMEVVVCLVICNSGVGLNVWVDKVEVNKCDLCNYCEDGLVCMVVCLIYVLICVDCNKFE